MNYFSKKAPNYQHLKNFDCLCHTKNVFKSIDKFDSRAKKWIFICYSRGQKWWKVYNLQNHSFYTSKDIVFYEYIYPYNQERGTINTSNNDAIQQYFDDGKLNSSDDEELTRNVMHKQIKF